MGVGPFCGLIILGLRRCAKSEALTLSKNLAKARYWAKGTTG